MTGFQMNHLPQRMAFRETAPQDPADNLGLRRSTRVLAQTYCFDQSAYYKGAEM